MKKSIATIFFVAVIAPTCLCAWGSDGHKIVDRIAYTVLTDAVRDSVQKYFGDTKFDDAGCWMDEVRGNHEFDYMKPWHYVNIEKGGKYDSKQGNNIVAELDSVIARLKHRQDYSKEKVAMDIKILMHLMGDLHQPLHDGYGSDKGGNKIEVSFFGHTSNLHKVWDSEIINHADITSKECLDIFKISHLAATGKSIIDIVDWMVESRSHIASAYDFKEAAIDESYVKKNKKVIEVQLALAGERLGAILNLLFAHQKESW